MGIGPEAIGKMVRQAINTQEEYKINGQQLALLYIEFGYKACERGESLEQAIMRYHELCSTRPKT